MPLTNSTQGGYVGNENLATRTAFGARLFMPYRHNPPRCVVTLPHFPKSGSRLGRFSQQRRQRPSFHRQPGTNSRSRLDSRVEATPIVPSELQAEHRIMIPCLLGVGIRQSREPPNLHTGCQVEPLHPAGSDLGISGRVARSEALRRPWSTGARHTLRRLRVCHPPHLGVPAFPGTGAA